MRRIGRFQTHSSLCAQAGGAETEPLLRIRADMALRMILLVDLCDLCNGVYLRADRGAHLVFERAALPVGQDLRAELRDILRPDLKAVLRASRQRFKFTVDPRRAGLREDDARAHAGRAVADDPLLGFQTDGHPCERGLQGARPADAGRLPLGLLIDLGDDPGLLDADITRLVQHFLLQNGNTLAAGQRQNSGMVHKASPPGFDKTNLAHGRDKAHSQKRTKGIRL